MASLDDDALSVDLPFNQIQTAACKWIDFYFLVLVGL